MFPFVTIASIMRPTGDTGEQAHFQTFLQYCAAHQVPAQLITPFTAPKALVYPVFAPRRLLGLFHGATGLWWYRFWHEQLLYLALRRRLAGAPRGVIYAQCPVAARAASRVALRSGHKVVLAVHFAGSQADLWVIKGVIREGSRMYRAIRRLESDVLPRLTGIICVSDFVAKRLRQDIPALAQVPTTVIPNAVADPHLPSAAAARADLVTIGQLEPTKNHAYLLEVLAAAAQRGHRYRLSVIGRGPDQRKLEARAQALGIADLVSWLGYQPQAIRLLPGHRAYCHASRMENLPIAMIEALACGLPVLTAPVGGIPEIARDGSEGFYWPLNDPARGAELLIRVLQNDALHRTLATAARRRFEEHFDATKVLPRLLDFLCQAATASPQR